MKLLYNIVSRFIDCFRLDDDTQTAPAPDPITDREKLEKQAYYILTQQNYEYPQTVTYMSDTMLMQIISNYTKPNLTRLELEQLAADHMKKHKIKNWYYIARVAPDDVLQEIIQEEV